MAGGAESLQGVLASQTQGLAGGKVLFMQKGRKSDLTTQDEYERETGSGAGGRGSEDLLSQVDSIVNCHLQNHPRHDCLNAMQGRQWEESGEYQRAVECYLKIDALATRSNDVLCFFLQQAHALKD